MFFLSARRAIVIFLSTAGWLYFLHKLLNSFCSVFWWVIRFCVLEWLFFFLCSVLAVKWLFLRADVWCWQPCGWCCRSRSGFNSARATDRVCFCAGCKDRVFLLSELLCTSPLFVNLFCAPEQFLSVLCRCTLVIMLFIVCGSSLSVQSAIYSSWSVQCAHALSPSLLPRTSSPPRASPYTHRKTFPRV